MATHKRVSQLSETSSDEEENERQSGVSRTKKPRLEDYGSSHPSRSTVIVSPTKSTKTASSIFNFSSHPSYSSQESDSSSGDIPSIHRDLIKAKRTSSPMIDDKARKMMASMGYKEGTGLGKNKQGIVNPVEVSKQRGRRGLGMQIKGLEAEEVEWDSEKEVIEVVETTTWIPEHNQKCPTLQELRNWIVEGEKKLTIDDETNFCDPEILQQVLQCKTIFDNLEPEEMRKARSRSNPFETIRGVFFLNRAAMKMANMDAIFDFMFTDPKGEDGKSLVASEELLYFADVCAGPGGFSEYVLWRKKWEAKGFGFTLRASNDFKLEDFYAAPSESFEPHYGVNGIEGDGNVYNPENIREFRRYVLSQTNGSGVHFMMADGGFSVEGQENIQEILSKRLYLCQCLVALAIVRPEGHFVCKLFDIFTPFSAGLIYLMYRAFKRVSIHKPNTSRPANSERYIICKWKRRDTKDIEDYLFEVNCRLQELSSSTSTIDVLEIVPLHMITEDQHFYEYLFESNNILGKRQVVNLAKIAAFCKDVSLREDRQAELRKQCLEFWRIPDKARVDPRRTGLNEKAKELLGNNPSILNSKPQVQLTNTSQLHEKIKGLYDWNCVALGLQNDENQTYFLSLGRNNVYRWDTSKSKWLKLTEKVELARDTLIYGELIQELRGEGRSQKRTYALHIIDAIYLGGIEVSSLHLRERFRSCRKFARSMNKPSRTDLVTIRAKEWFKLENIESIFQRLQPRVIKNSNFAEREVFCIDDDSERAYLPSGLLLYKSTKEPWTVAVSKTSGSKYWFHVKNRASFYDCPKDSIANFFECQSSRLVWWWKRDGSLQELDREEFSSFVHGLPK